MTPVTAAGRRVYPDRAQLIRLRRFLTWLAGIVAIAVAVVVPLIYILTAYKYETLRVERTARDLAEVVSGFIYSHPDLWEFSTDRLERILLSRAGDEQLRQLLHPNGDIIAASQAAPNGGTPVTAYRLSIEGSADVFNGQIMVGTIHVAESLSPVLIATGWIALLGSVLAFAVFAVLRALPLRVLDNALNRLQRAHFDLQARVARHKKAEIALRDSEQSLANAQRLAHLGHWDWDIVTGSLHMSDEAFRIYGFEPQAFPATLDTCLQAIHPDDRQRVAESVDRTISLGQHFSNEFRILRPDGAMRHVHERGEASYDDDGTPVRMSGTVYDITERKNAEEALRESEAKFSSVVNNSPTKIHIKDLEGRYLLINSEAEKLYGVTDAEIKGKTTHEIFPDKQANDFGAHDQAVLDTGHTLEQEEYWELDDGSRIYLTVKFPIRNKDGEITAIGAIGTDITERKAGEDAVIAAMKEAEVANRAKSEFLANMSHELRTPLNAIIGFSDIIKDERLGSVGSARYRDYAGDINESGQHLLCLINDILDLSKVESGADELYEENADIPEIVGSIVRLLTEVAQTGNVDLVFEVPEGTPGLRADVRKLKQILVNLLSNAIKFTPDGGKVIIKAWSRAESGHVLQVIDTGIGIAFEDIPKALAPFQQIDSGLNRRHEGTGLGLPLAKSLVELHGGHLDLQSEVGVGTTVTVRFPAERIVLASGDTKAASAGDRKTG